MLRWRGQNPSLRGRPAPETLRQRPLVVHDRPAVFVGCEGELAHLREWFTAMLQGTRQVVFITGEAGIGKTANEWPAL